MKVKTLTNLLFTIFLVSLTSCGSKLDNSIGKYVDDEEERVDMAIKILAEEGKIYEVYCPDYNFEKLESIIEEHVHKYEIGYVFFDYIHTTADLIAEYAEKASRSMAIREDQVLAELSTKLKNLCRMYNVSFDTCTQVSVFLKSPET